jgi:hypothetical protein
MAAMPWGRGAAAAGVQSADGAGRSQHRRSMRARGPWHGNPTAGSACAPGLLLLPAPPAHDRRRLLHVGRVHDRLGRAPAAAEPRRRDAHDRAKHRRGDEERLAGAHPGLERVGLAAGPRVAVPGAGAGGRVQGWGGRGRRRPPQTAASGPCAPAPPASSHPSARAPPEHRMQPPRTRRSARPRCWRPRGRGRRRSAPTTRLSWRGLAPPHGPHAARTRCRGLPGPGSWGAAAAGVGRRRAPRRPPRRRQQQQQQRGGGRAPRARAPAARPRPVRRACSRPRRSTDPLTSAGAGEEAVHAVVRRKQVGQAAHAGREEQRGHGRRGRDLVHV